MKIEKFEKSLNLLEKIKYHSEDESKASEEFKEKHPTHRGLPVGNQVDGFGSVIDQDLPALPIIEIVIKLEPTLCSVSYVMIQTATAFIAAAGVGISIVGHACSNHPWMTLFLMTIFYTLGALVA